MLKPYRNKNLRKYLFRMYFLRTNAVIYRLRLDSSKGTRGRQQAHGPRNEELRGTLHQNKSKYMIMVGRRNKRAEEEYSSVRHGDSGQRQGGAETKPTQTGKVCHKGTRPQPDAQLESEAEG